MTKLIFCQNAHTQVNNTVCYRNRLLVTVQIQVVYNDKLIIDFGLLFFFKVKKKGKIRNPCNQRPHLTRDRGGPMVYFKESYLFSKVSDGIQHFPRGPTFPGWGSKCYFLWKPTEPVIFLEVWTPYPPS